MAAAYKKYLKLNIDSSCLGVERWESKSMYFCTPRRAKVIGWSGVDGIHYCFVRGFGEMVFAVSPMNVPEDYVHPIAGSFTDFLRLLLTCGDAAALEQAHRWDQVEFNAFLRDNPPTEEQRAALEIIQTEMKIAPMEQPFSYIRKLQSGFDYSGIKYKREYYEQVSCEPEIREWKVYFDGNFRGHSKGERAGREISLDKQFVWGDEIWHILAIYTCSKGWVVDFFVQIPPERIRAFVEKWELSAENDGTNLTKEQRMEAEAEHPLGINIDARLVLNGITLPGSHSSFLSWNPCFPEGNDPETESVIRHYGLDADWGWAIQRTSFPWTKKRKPQIKELSVILEQRPITVAGPHFRVSKPGDSIEFTHPATGMIHTLTVQQYEGAELSSDHLDGLKQGFPTHRVIMSYTLSPDLPDERFTVTDCADSDSFDSSDFSSVGVIGIGIIGGADGPTTIMYGGAGQDKAHTACSAFHFKPAEEAEWRMMFHEKTREDINTGLI